MIDEDLAVRRSTFRSVLVPSPKPWPQCHIRIHPPTTLNRGIIKNRP